MEKQNDINSTEKLLNAIRGNLEEANNEIGQASILSSKELPIPQKNNKFSWLFSNKQEYTIGIDISHDFIFLVKTIFSSEGSPILIDQKIIKYDEKIAQGSPEFNSLLKASILSICGNPANCNIWTIIPAGDVNIQHVKIPPVPKKQMGNAIYWAAKKELSFDEKDYIFDYELQEEITDKGIPKHSVMVYLAPVAEIEKRKALFSNIGITLAGITIAPFAVQNIYRTDWLPASEGTTATLFIGNEFSRISIYKKNNLVMTRGIKTGVGSMIEAITESFVENKIGLRLEKDEAKRILFSLGTGSEKINKILAEFDLKENEIFNMIIPVIERVARQIERTFQHYATSTGHEKIEKLYISSVMEIYNPISDYISDQLGVKIEVFDPFKYKRTNSLVEDITFRDRMSLILALGLSFSDNRHTPNLIFTYKEDNQEIRIRRINRGIISAFAAGLIICSTTIIYQGVNVFALNKQRENLKKEVSLFNPHISKEKVTQLANEIKKQRNYSRQYAEKYLGMAVIGEISALTPENIKLNSLKIIASVNSAIKEKTDKTVKGENSKGITLEGIITGERNMLDQYLTQYIMKLNNSPMLCQASVIKNSIVNFKKNDVLQFTINAKTGKQ